MTYPVVMGRQPVAKLSSDSHSRTSKCLKICKLNLLQPKKVYQLSLSESSPFRRWLVNLP